MSRRESDSFLPSGAIPSPPRSLPPSSSISPSTNIPRTMPMIMDAHISPFNTSAHSPRDSSRSPARKPKPYTLQQHSNHSPSQNPPISPPKTRSASAENNSDALIEDWRCYTEKLRAQHAGERAHMMADRKRMEEVNEEERQLWEQERAIFKARVAELEQKVGEMEGRGRATGVGVRSRDASVNRIAPGMAPRHSIQQQALYFTSPGSNAVSVTGSVDGMPSRKDIAQESGRNPDGSPFYAPAPRNPSRTFSSSLVPTDDLRVDSISAPRESAIRVTSKTFTSADFGPQSPPTRTAQKENSLDSIPEVESGAISESIDISLIQPELEGVPIKASAVSPAFAATVLSPKDSPLKLSPNEKPPGRDVENLSPSSRNSVGRENCKGKLNLKEVMHAPVDRRLTMHAGHTPNHSISKFDFGDSGSATPTQEATDSQPRLIDSNKTHDHEHGHAHHIDRPSVANFDGADSDDTSHGDDGDRELTGQLGLTNNQATDDPFLAQLHEKVSKLAEERTKSEGLSPSSVASDDSLRISKTETQKGEGKDKEADDVPPLRLKPSSNFGRPLGKM